ncbi:MAG TPA: metalloregulator ArsR/SmtB family transcription factor [Chromatiales bacterium]|nr:metalloregulator ArsR/SmtB family transcription factor [Chromatiales bacterium]
MDANTFFRALGDGTRLRCLLLLAAAGELCVCELTCALAVTQPKVSRHLALLREAGVVRDRRAGLWVHYRIREDLPEWAQQVLQVTLAGVTRREPFARDRARLARMPNRPGAPRCA